MPDYAATSLAGQSPLSNFKFIYRESADRAGQRSAIGSIPVAGSFIQMIERANETGELYVEN